MAYHITILFESFQYVVPKGIRFDKTCIGIRSDRTDPAYRNVFNRDGIVLITGNSSGGGGGVIQKCVRNMCSEV